MQPTHRNLQGVQSLTCNIETYKGIAFDPLNPRLEDIDIVDIAHALSNQCRFAGHCKTFYSVAEHSVRVSWVLKDWGCSPAVQLEGLLHDASEAYLVDIPTPIKVQPEFAAYRRAEDRLMNLIHQRFNIKIKETTKEVVKSADLFLLNAEVCNLMPARKEHWPDLLQTSEHENTGSAVPYLQPTTYSPSISKELFLNKFYELEHEQQSIKP